MKTILTVILSLFLVTSSNADEVIFNKDWNPVLLKDDHTWEFIDVKGNEGNIVFSVVNVKTELRESIVENEFGELVYDYGLYFTFKVSVENKTSHPVYIDKIRLYPVIKMYDHVYIYFNKKIEPGEKYIPSKRKMWCVRCVTPQRALSREEKTQLRDSIKAEDLHGKVQLVIWHGESIKFQERAGISERALEELVVIDNEYSVFPLTLPIIWGPNEE